MGLVCWEFCLTAVNVDGAGMWTFGLSTCQLARLPSLCQENMALPIIPGKPHEKRPSTNLCLSFGILLRCSNGFTIVAATCFFLQMFSRIESSKALSTTFHWAASLYGAYLVGAALDACLEQRQRRRWRNQRGWTKVLPFFTIDSWVELLAEALSWHKSGDLFDGLSIKDMQSTQAIH